MVFSSIGEWFSGDNAVRAWFVLFLASILIAGIWTGYLKARKIQQRGFKWKTFRNEVFFSIINVAISGTIIGFSLTWMLEHGWVKVSTGPVTWWVIALQYAAYFVLFDTWFYWLHRAMHQEPIYTYVHKLHHFSTSPNFMTTFSVNPLESVINGGFVPLFLLAMSFVMPVHEQAMALITPTNVIMGLWVHSGYEVLPRWWNKSWATKWFISATFHDQHHKYFKVNYGGYTTVWDRLCGTLRPKFEADFDAVKARPIVRGVAVAAKDAPST